MKIIGVIPARYESTRFPGKPLADICGKPMIWWVYQQCLKVKDFSEVYVATDSEKIESVCKNFGMNCILTSKHHLTGTDRVAEVAQKISSDLYVNIQGDEPLIEPETIRAAIEPFYLDENIQIVNLMTRITNPVDLVNFTVPKVIASNGRGIYLTRATCPYPKGNLHFDYYKQVCVYGFKLEPLKFFCEYGKKYGKSKLESIEDIEILRLIENGYPVKYVEVNSNTVAVDTPKDLQRVRELMEAKL